MTSREEKLEAAFEAQRALRQAVQSKADPAWLSLDLTMGQLKALFILADASLAVGEVGAQMGISKPAASLLVDSLVRLDLASRTEDPLDRRRTRVSLTARGQDRVAQLRQGGEARWRSWLSRLSADDLDAVTRGFAALARVAAADHATPSTTMPTTPPGGAHPHDHHAIGHR